MLVAADRADLFAAGLDLLRSQDTFFEDQALAGLEPVDVVVASGRVCRLTGLADLLRKKLVNAYRPSCDLAVSIRT